jgi:ELP3 family radical SAM enzyme/protein acetyltransferase
MLNLPGSDAEKDNEMLNEVLLGLKSPVIRKTVYEPRSWIDWLQGRPRKIKEFWEIYDINAPELSVETWKIYPCAVTPFTEIEKWFKDGTYKPYPEKEMFEMLVTTMRKMYPWIRVARVIRDIPEIYMYNQNTGADNTNMRQELNDELKQRDIYSMDIRNREVKNLEWDGTYVIIVRQYANVEFFLSAESYDKRIIYGFVRLRLDHAQGKAFPELDGCALIREVHVYGDLTKVGKEGQHVQHRGIGRTLVGRAEQLAREHNYIKIAVIAAEGNKEYYKKLGFHDDAAYMVKNII